GANPQLRLRTSSRRGTPTSCHIAFKRRPAVEPSRRFTSTLVRPEAALPPVARISPKFARAALLVTRFTDPPVEPRPVVTDDGPLATSTVSASNVSRVTTPESLAPST